MRKKKIKLKEKIKEIYHYFDVSKNMKAEFVKDVLNKAIQQHKPKPGLIFHLDQGRQYTSRLFVDYCEYKGIKQSMSRKGTPYDAIIVTCAPETIPASLVKQLKTGGIMCIPVGSPYYVQELLVIKKLDDENIEKHMITQVRFVPLVREEKKL